MPIKHGFSPAKKRHYLYIIWLDIKQRCFNPRHAGWKDYGGRGITIYDPWVNNPKRFILDVLGAIGEKPDGYSIDRKDVNVGYYPGNLKWSTKAQQNRNMRRNRFITALGETMTISEWAVKIGVSHSCISKRLRKGWPIQFVVSPCKKAI